MTASLIKLSDHLDSIGNYKLASAIDDLIALAGLGGSIDARDLLKLKPDVMKALKDAITFDLVLERDPDGDGNFVRAIPKIQDKWTDGLELGDISETPGLNKFLDKETFEEVYKDVPEVGEHDVEYVPTAREHENLSKSLEHAQKYKLDTEEFVEPSARSEEGERRFQQRQRQLENLERGRRQNYPQAPQTPPPLPQQPRYKTVEPTGGFMSAETTGADDEWHAMMEQRRLEKKWDDLMEKYQSYVPSIDDLIALADIADESGNVSLASKIDKLITAVCSQKTISKKAAHRTITLKDLLKINPQIAHKLLDAVQFEIDLQNTPQGRVVSGVPVIDDTKLWFTDRNVNRYVGETPPGVGGVEKPEDAESAIENIMTPEAKETEKRLKQEQQSRRDKELEDVFYSEHPEQVPSGAFEWKKRSPTEMRSMSPEERQEIEQIRKDLSMTGREAEEAVETSPMIPEEERDIPMLGPNQFRKADLINELIKMADKFDSEGKTTIASEIDKTIDSLVTNAARPKAPLKDLNDDVKKSLIVFLGNACGSMNKGVSDLNELFRRLRYFDIADSIKDLGLDRAVKDMERTKGFLDGAQKDFYTMTYGKRPSKSDLDSLFGGDDEADDGKSALDFFNSQLPSDDVLPPPPSVEQEEEKSFEEETEEPLEVNEDENDYDADDDELDVFWKEYNESMQ